MASRLKRAPALPTEHLWVAMQAAIEATPPALLEAADTFLVADYGSADGHNTFPWIADLAQVLEAKRYP